MNLLLLHPHELIPTAHTHQFTAVLRDRRATHLIEVHGAAPGDHCRAGIINGAMGAGEILHMLPDGSVEILINCQQPPPPALPVTLIVALPRPKMLKRILQTVATMGVKELIFINSYRVEKSYWSTPLLEPSAVEEQLLLGLEQGVDTVLPTVRRVKRFKPFVEDELPTLCQGRRALVAHPRHAEVCPVPDQQETVLLIGPEGGFIDYEIEKLIAAGCQPIHLGPRILRVETAVPVLLSRLFSL